MDQSKFEVDAEDGAPAPGTRRPLPWAELGIDEVHTRKRRDDGSVFVVGEGRLAGGGRVEFFLTLADDGNSLAVERGVAIVWAMIAAGSDPATTTEHETLLAAVAQRLVTLRPIEVTGMLVERQATFPRLEIDDVRRPVSAATAAEAAP